MFIHLELLTEVDGTRFFLARGFTEPLGEIDPDTKQPFKDYACYANLIVKDRSCEVCCMVRPMPADAIVALQKQVAPELGLREIFWWRWRGRKKRKFFLPLDRKLKRLR